MDSCNIKVAIKARPLNENERLDGRVYWKVEFDSIIHVDPITEKRNGDQFFFDRIYCDNSSNYDVFDEIVRPIIDRGVQGFNGTVFAYGQTASGKTYTMSGDQLNPGIIPLAINYMFDAMNNSTSREYLLRACYLEIYNEKVIDLLETKDNKNVTKKIEIQKDGLHITPLKAVVCQNAQMVLDLMKIGEKNRSIGETNMNERSSRSHTIFRIILESRNVDDDCDGAYQQSVINLVDLAGSERSIQTQSSMERFKEGCKINSSLTTLGLVIQQLSECPDSSQYINFRDSKLTRILQTSLGGNSLTAIICTVTLAVDDQTLNTLSFASRAKKIKNSAKVNENVTDETLLKRYRVQLSKLNKELEGMKQNQYENDEVNEIRYKYQVEKQANEELKERIMRLQKNMITSVGHKDKPLNKKGFNRRRTWGGKLDNTFSSNSILETIEEDINLPRPSVPSNFGNHNNDFKTPLEPFEWDLIREEDRKVDTTNNENTEHDISPPSNVPAIICETPKKVLRERVNNYKSLFEMSMKENNELREFTTLEKQMFYENNEQLKDLSYFKKQVNDLQTEKNESTTLIEKLKCSIQLIENEKRDIEVIMDMQKNKYEKRETELLATIEETRQELKSKEEQLKSVISKDTFIVEKQEEIKVLEMKIKEMSLLNCTYVNEIETMKSQLLDKDQQLDLESSRHRLLLDELSNLQSYVAEIKSVPCAIKLLAQEGYFALRKDEINELDQLLEHIYNTAEQLQKENQSLIDENNNLKCITNDFTEQINITKGVNDELNLKLNLIESNIRSIINDFSASSEIDVENSDTNTLIKFADQYFERTYNKVNELTSENHILREKLSLSDNKLDTIKSYIFSNIDNIFHCILTMEVQTTNKMEKLKIELSETIKENIFLMFNIQTFDKLISECVEIVEQAKINESNVIHLKEDLAVCYAIKKEFQVQIEQLNGFNANLKTTIEKQSKVEKEIREELEAKQTELESALFELGGKQLIMKDNELITDSNTASVNQLNIELEETKLVLLNKCNELEKCHQSYAKNVEQNQEIEKRLRDELVLKTDVTQNYLDQIKETKIQIELNDSEIEKLNILLDSLKSEKLKLITELENKSKQIDRLGVFSSDLQIKLEENEVSKNKIQEKLLTKTKELNDALSQISVFQLTIEEMKLKTDSNTVVIEKQNIELDSIKLELKEKSEVIEKFENDKSETLKSNHLEKIKELNEIINKLKYDLEEKSKNEKILKNELQIVTVDLDHVIVNMAIKVKSVIDILNNKYESNMCIIEQLNYELEYIKSTLAEKINLIVMLENTNSELLTKCKNSEVIDHLNKIINELEIKLENKTKIENEMQDKLQIKTMHLKDALVRENEVQTLVESMEKEIKLYIDSIEQLKSDLTSKSNFLIELETHNSELLVQYTKIQDLLQAVTHEKQLIHSDFNLVSQKFLDVTKHNEETKMYLENILQFQVLNFQKLYTDFVNLSCDVETLLEHKMNTESILKEEIQLKDMELDDLRKQTHDSSLQQEYEKLEEEYILRCQECDAAQQQIINLESILSSKEESETTLRNNLKSKCMAIEEYKKNVEYLFSRNDSFQFRFNDFEENVLVDLDVEFDSMRSELAKKIEREKMLLEDKSELQCNLSELQEKLSNVTKKLEISEKRSQDLTSIINVLVIEIKDANFVRENLQTRLNEAEHELLKSEDLIENLKSELHTMHLKLENQCIKVESVENQLRHLESKFIDKMNKRDLESSDIRNQLIDPLVDHVHDIKLKLTELNSAMISGNKSEKQFRTKIMSFEDDILPLDENWKVNCHSKSTSDIEIGLEIDNLRKTLEDKMNLINTLEKAKSDGEKNVNELQEEIETLSDDNNKLVEDIMLVESDLKKKSLLASNLNNELNQIKKQYTELEEHNRAIKEQIHYSFDIDAELRTGKKNLVNEINLLEPGKVTGVLTNHNLSNLLDIFVNLIITKEKQIVTDLVNDHNKIKQQHEDQIKQYQEDIKKVKEWQEQVESDNEKLCVELENLKSQKHNFPSREIEIKELTEKVLDAESQSFNYLCELQELKTQFSKNSEQNYQALSDEFEVFKTSSEQSIQDLKIKLEDLTNKYNESLIMYTDQKSGRATLESQINNIQSECDCLKAIIQKKDEDIKNLLDNIKIKTNDYELLIKKNSLQKEEMKDIHTKKIDELQLELNTKTQKLYCTEKLLKEVTKNYSLLVEESSLNPLKIKHVQENDNSVHLKIAELESDIQTITTMNKEKLENLKTELKSKCKQLNDTDAQCSKLVDELKMYKLKITTFENQLESCYQTLKLKDDQIENYQMKSESNEKGLIEINIVTEKLRNILKCTGTLPTLYENISSLMTKCEHLEEEIDELKHININLDNECESMLLEIKHKDDKIIEFMTREDELNQSIEMLTEEKNCFKNKYEQLKNVKNDTKKLNDEICGYEQNIYQLRKEKGQLIVQHDKELTKLKAELNEVHAKNLELLNEYNKLSETARNMEKSLKDDIQQLNRCIVDKNAKISTSELLFKTNNDELKKKNIELEHVFKRVRDENHMLRKELRRFKEMTNVKKSDQYTQTAVEQSVVGSAIMADHKIMTEKIIKLENDNKVLKKILHNRKVKNEELQKQLDERHS